MAAVMAGACCLAVECDEKSAEFRKRTRYVDEITHDLDDALAMIEQWTKAGEAKSVGLIGNAADVFPEIYKRGIRPDIVTDQTSAHDPLNGYLPQGWSVAEWRAKAETAPKEVEAAARASMKVHVAAMVDFWNDGVPTVDYGNNIRQVALEEGLENAFAFPGFVPAYIRPLFCKVLARFAGPLCRVIQRISTRPTRRSKSCCLTTPICTIGSTWRASASRFRACLRGSAGWVLGIAIGWVSPSTRWSKTES